MRYIRLRWQTAPYLVKNILLAALYFTTAKVGLQFATVGQNVTLVWPPAGLALAALVLSDLRLWPGVALGAFAVHITTGFALPEVTLVTFGNTFEAVAGAYLLKRFVQFHPSIDRVRDVLGFVFFAVIISPCISASIGTFSLLLQNEIQLSTSLVTGLTWWAGDAMGILTLAPVLLLWAAAPYPNWTHRQIIEAASIVFAAVAISVLVFRNYAMPDGDPLAYLTFPLLIWVALRFGQRGTTSIALVISVIAVWSTGEQLGPFARADLNRSELFLSTFIVVEIIMSMLLAAVLAENKRVTEALKQERDFATQIMKTLGQGVTVTGADGRFEYVNAAYARMAGCQPEDLIGKKPEDVTVPEDLILVEKANKDRQDGQTTTYEARLRRADGEIVHTLVSGSPRWQGDSIQGAIAAVTDLTTQKYIETALRESEARLQAVIENLPVHLWATDSDGRYILQSPPSIRQWGDIVGKRLEDLTGLSDKTRQSWYEIRRSVLLGETVHGEIQYEVDGDEHYFYYITSPIHDGAATLGMLGVDIDVTDLKRTEQALKKTEESNRVFLERLKALHEVSIELAGVETIDELARRAIELGRSELKFDRLGLWFVDDDMQRMRGTYGTDEQGNLRDERAQVLPFNIGDYPLQEIHNGAVRLFVNQRAQLFDHQYQTIGTGWSAIAYLQDAGHLMGFLSTDNLLHQQPLESYQLELLSLYAHTVGNLCIRKRAEQKLRDAEEKFSKTFHSNLTGISISTLEEGRFEDVNETFVHLLGYERDEIIGRTAREVNTWSNPGERDEILRILREKGSVQQREIRFRTKSGELRDMLTSLEIIDLGGKNHLLGMLQDITERKRTQDALAQLTADLEKRVIERTAELEKANLRLTELDRLKTKFIADVSHELRTPLAVLNTRVYLLQHAQPEKHPEYLNALKFQIERLTNFVNTILDLSRLELGADKVAFGPVSINDIAEQVVSTLSPRAELAGLTLDLHMSDALPPVRGELNQLAQVATNLVANAINYTPNGSIHVRTCLDQDQVSFEVQDTGVGIQPEDLSHLFERFYRGERASQSNIPGTGLGLSIVKEIVDLHNGEIDVDSEVGKGSRFRVRLPRWQD